MDGSKLHSRGLGERLGFGAGVFDRFVIGANSQLLRILEREVQIVDVIGAGRQRAVQDVRDFLDRFQLYRITPPQ